MTDQLTEEATVDTAPSFDEELASVFDEVTGQGATEEPEPTEAETATQEEPEQPEVEAEATEPETPGDPSPEAVKPPNSWTAEAKQKFSALDPLVQQEVLKRESDYSRKIQESSERAKLSERFEAIAAPYRPMLAAEGATAETAFESLLNTAYRLRTGSPQEKSALILDLAHKYGVELNQSGQEQDDVYVDPDIKALREEIASLKNQQQSQLYQAQTAEQAALRQQIHAFSSDPQNEHFEKVKGEMSALLQAGKAQTLEDAYSQALWLNPETREAMVAAKVKAENERRIKEETDKAAKAKRAAGVNLRNEDAGLVPELSGDLDDDLAKIYDSIEARK